MTLLSQTVQSLSLSPVCVSVNTRISSLPNTVPFYRRWTHNIYLSYIRYIIIHAYSPKKNNTCLFVRTNNRYASYIYIYVLSHALHILNLPYH